MTRWMGWVAFLWLIISPVRASAEIPIAPVAAGNQPALSTSMKALAAAAVAEYRTDDRDTYLDNLSRLQIVAEQYGDALASLRALRTLREHDASLQKRVGDVQYEIFASAKLSEQQKHIPFASAFENAFHAIFDAMDDRTSALVVRALNVQNIGGLSLIVDLSALKQSLAQDLAQQKGKHSISLADAVTLIRAYQIEETYRSIEPLVSRLVAADDQRRYIIEPEVPVKSVGGAIICALIVRPRAAAKPVPTLMEFGIYADLSSAMSEARRDASNGYAGIQGFSRGKLCSPGAAVPIEHDGADADALIDWAAKQPWSDGRVGMYGASYDGFAVWAAAKHMPAALKGMMDSVTMAPGIDMPSEGNIHQSFSYYWPFYVATNKTLAGGAFEDRSHWNRLFAQWYRSGRAYRDLDKIDGTPNPVWDRWVSHPSYDSYWQGMIPYGDEFAHVNVPVLTTTGYYDGGQIGALYYLTEHTRHLPGAEHYLVIGPYDHGSGNRGTMNVLGEDVGTLDGYQLDPAAHIDLGDLRFQWFDYLFRHGPKPAILKDRINYEVMGADEWKHARSLGTMYSRRLDFHLTGQRTENAYRMTPEAPTQSAPIVQSVNLADRRDVDRIAPGGNIVDKAIDTWDGLQFVSDPIKGPFEISGLFTGHLDFITNKKDFDFFVQLFELMPDGRFFELSWYMARASFVSDRSRRQLLQPGVRQQLDFTSGRLTSRRLEPGSRLVVVLSVIKEPDIEINYGSGKTVAEETISDAGNPLSIEWLPDSFIGVPFGR